MQVRGTVRLKETIRATEVPFGDNSIIAGEELGLLEENKEGDCLCLFGRVGLIDVKRVDIAEVTYNKMTRHDLLFKRHSELLDSFLKEKLGEGIISEPLQPDTERDN